MKNNFKLAFVGALCAFPSIAQACSCAPPPAPKVALEKSAAVFVGRVTAVENNQFNNKFQFAVSKQWKGIKGKTASIVSATNSAACGIVFDKDRDYLVYAYKTEGDEQLRTNLCTRTARAADAATDLAELGDPTTGYPTSMMNYPKDNNGVVQISAHKNSDPLMALTKALQNNPSAQNFRVSWTAPTSDSFSGTSLYNRKNSTLKAYSRAKTDGQIKVSSVLYSGVSDKILQQLASTKKIEDFFRTYASYGVTKRDVGSKTVSISG